MTVRAIETKYRMSESVTISRKTPEAKSQNYDFLREEGIKHIQSLAGKIWTDYNVHDPGVSILEVLAFAITELGYRAGYNIEDLLENDPKDANARDIRNFFTAREVLPNCPVTINDYRKLLIDVDVDDPDNPECAHVGVKNAWIEKSKGNEIPVYVHKQDSKLSYHPDPMDPGQAPLEIGILYDILLEFEKCDEYGDLNENSISNSLVIEEHEADPNVVGLTIKISIDFPRWDSEHTDWEDPISIKSNIQNISIQFSNVPSGYDFGYELVNNIVKLQGTITTAADVVDVPNLIEIENQINEFIYHGEDSLLNFYLQKIDKIYEIIEAVKARLHANRNLCEDFYKLSALKVEKIAVCADVELSQEADVEEVEAEIFHEIARFLSPTVYFYTLDEMLDKCKELQTLEILEIDATNQYFKVAGDLEEQLTKGDSISISGSRSNDGDYNVTSITVNKDALTTKIFVDEDIHSELLTEGEVLTFYVTNEDECLSVDEIFEGPALDHGFIDDNELEKANRKRYIHVSDLIQIIMDVPGVIAVKSIQVANLPQDNEGELIESKSVKWCLQLAFEHNYVPRLSISDSKITYYKDQLPFRASSSEVEELIDELESEERTPKLFNPVLDFEIPRGSYSDLESYQSIQNEFPATYGIGDEGLPALGSDKEANKLRRAQAKQLKGFLMHFDQLLANYFSQLAHVKDLFTMNAEKDEYGNYVIGRTYYTQPLFDIVPNVDELYVDQQGHAVVLDDIAESQEDFFRRKNKFLDHLLGRFAEQFTDYALLTFKISGKVKAPKELVEDKLAFLNDYPAISSGRGKGFDHQDSCNIWHVDNISGLRRRASFLTGIEETRVDDLHFNAQFAIVADGDEFAINILNDDGEVLLKSHGAFESEDEAKQAMEKLILVGFCKDNYKTLKTPDSSDLRFALHCESANVTAISEKQDYADDPGGHALIEQHVEQLIQLFSSEFYGNAESNRNNLGCDVDNYLRHRIHVDMVPDPPIATVSYDQFGAPCKNAATIISVDTSLGQIVVEGNIADMLQTDDELIIEASNGNDGNYTVISATDNGPNTDINVNETIPSNAAPFGELLYALPDKILTGQYIIEGDSKAEVDIISVDVGLQQITVDGNIASLLETGDTLIIDNSQDNDGIYSVDSATDVGGNTEIIVNEPITSDNAPLGELLYNTESPESLLKKAEEQVADIGWQLILNASKKERYLFSSESGAYRFEIINSGGLQLGESVESDFNETLATEISNLASGVVQISGSTGNDGQYTISTPNGAVATGPDITITVDENLTSAEAEGYVNFGDSFSYTVEMASNSFTITSDLGNLLFVGDRIKIAGSASIDGIYTITSVAASASETVVRVNESISAKDNSGTFSYSKSYPISEVGTNTITFKGGYEHKAVKNVIDFITSKFFSREGFHIVEHVLLRPKVKGEHFIAVDDETLTEGLADQGFLYYNKTTPIYSASSSADAFKVDGDISSDLDKSKETAISSEIMISRSGSNDGQYQVKSVSYDAGKDRSTIKTIEEVPSDILYTTPVGDLSYMVGTSVAGISATTKSILVSEPAVLDLIPGEVIEIRDSTDGVNDGRFLIEEVVDNGGAQEIIVSKVEAAVQDELLGIVLDENECDSCQIRDPYTCIASVVLPYWQGRFDNMDFRRFFEKQLRLEAPAHVFLTICWISCEQMNEFELKYKSWLVENAKEVKDHGVLSTRLNELIDILSRLRNVYPSGILHDCAEDETLENAVILDNSVLGNA